MYILGISCYYHDSAAALIQDGNLIAASEEERFSRKKHDHSFPHHSIKFCLDTAGITAQDLDYVVFYEKPLKKFERILSTTLQQFPQSYKVFREAMIAWFNEKLWVKSEILAELNIKNDKLLFVEHHLSHAASAFFTSPFDEAAVLTIDGVGEWTTTTIGHGKAYWEQAPAGAPLDFKFYKENNIDLTNEVKFPHSLGLLYSAFTAFLGFRVNNGEYKVMGMAPYGRPTREEEIYKVINVGADGSFRLDMDYFDFHQSTKRTYSDKFIELFGDPRIHDATFYTPTTHPKQDHPQWDTRTATINQEYADIAASVQRVTEDTILKIVNHAYKTTGSHRLCLAGGVALNSVANGRILRESPFEDVYIQPSSGDAGAALGCALYAYHVLLGQPRKFVMEHAYWGAEYDKDTIKSAATAAGYSGTWHDIESAATELVQDMIAGKVITLYQGRAEWGPRALGNRSIMADPRISEMKLIVNESIKFREPFRPFAPVVLEENVHDYWKDVGDEKRNYALRYMLAVYQSHDTTYDVIPAVTHAGDSGIGSGRIQTVRSEWNPLYHRVVQKFGEETGVPVLLNTSFNLRGEPMVNSPADAMKTFTKSGIATICMDGYIIRK